MILIYVVLIIFTAMFILKFTMLLVNMCILCNPYFQKIKQKICKKKNIVTPISIEQIQLKKYKLQYIVIENPSSNGENKFSIATQVCKIQE